MNNIYKGSNNIKKNLNIDNFIFVYKRYTLFSKEVYSELLDNDIFGQTIRVNINNYGDFLGNIDLLLNLNSVKLPKNINNQSIDISNELNNLNNFNSYIKLIYIAYRYIKNKLNILNITPLIIVEELTNLFDNSNDFINYEQIKNNINNEFILKNTDINNNLVDIYNDFKDSLADNLILDKMKVEIENINSKLISYHRLYYYEPYKKVLEIQNNYNKNAYNFSWIENIGKFIIDEVNFYINNIKIESIYSDWLNIWDELTLTKYKKEKIKVISGDIDKMTNYNNEEKPNFNLYINLKFWFNRISLIYLPILLLNKYDIFLEIKFNNILDCIYTNFNNDEEYLLKDYIKVNKVELINEYYFLDFDEKLKYNKDNYYSIVNIVDKDFYKLDINILTNDSLDKNYEYILNTNYNYPISQLFIIFQSEGLRNLYNFKNNYYGIDSISSNDNYYSIISKIPPILNIELRVNNYLINSITDHDLFNKISQIKNHTNINDSIYLYNFSLYPESNQPSGHINIKNANSFNIKIIFNHKFIDFLDNLFNNQDNILIKLFPVYYKEFNIEQKILKYI